MMIQRETLAMASRRRLLQNFSVLTKRTKYFPTIHRNLSSATPAVEEEFKRSPSNWTKSTEELKQILKQQQRASANASGVASQIDKSEVLTPDIANDTQPPNANAHCLKSPTQLTYTGNATIPITTELRLIKPEDDTPQGVWPIFRLMDEDGSFRDGSTDGFRFSDHRDLESLPRLIHDSTSEDCDLGKLRDELKALYPNHTDEIDRCSLFFPSLHPYADTKSTNTLRRAYTQMIRLREMDQILQNAQRQGRISFYMTCHGEEAIHIGSASALEPQDVVLAQYREAGLLMWRGFTLQQFADQCFSNKADLGKGRQMPVHYGSRALNYQTISSPLGTQIPQAAGAAYRLKLAGKDAVAACFFGDGCASTTDFHSGLNFAATLRAPVIFFCRNNGYAISTSVVDQYRGDGIVSRAPGYGMAGIRVDGNDVFAVHAAVREARAYALENKAPVLIEAMTYRQGHHSTSDDSLRYRSAKEVQSFADKWDPVKRLKHFLQKHIEFPDADATEMQDVQKIDVIDAMRQAEQKPKPPLEDLFTDVYKDMPLSLQRQQAQLQSHLKTYPKQY